MHHKSVLQYSFPFFPSSSGSSIPESYTRTGHGIRPGIPSRIPSPYIPSCPSPERKRRYRSPRRLISAEAGRYGRNCPAHTPRLTFLLRTGRPRLQAENCGSAPPRRIRTHPEDYREAQIRGAPLPPAFRSFLCFQGRFPDSLPGLLTARQRYSTETLRPAPEV